MVLELNLAWKSGPPLKRIASGSNPARITNFFKMKKEIKSSYGYWKVTTEGDVEGRSERDLGTFRGHLDEIAFHLANKCYYSLRFTPIEENDLIPEFDINGVEVNISFDINTGTWDMGSQQRVEYVKEILKGRTDVGVEEGNYYASTKLISKKKKSRNELLKEQAMSKLTEDEKKVLGLI